MAGVVLIASIIIFEYNREGRVKVDASITKKKNSGDYMYVIPVVGPFFRKDGIDTILIKIISYDQQFQVENPSELLGYPLGPLTEIHFHKGDLLLSSSARGYYTELSGVCLSPKTNRLKFLIRESTGGTGNRSYLSIISYDPNTQSVIKEQLPIPGELELAFSPAGLMISDFSWKERMISDLLPEEQLIRCSGDEQILGKVPCQCGFEKLHQHWVDGIALRDRLAELVKNPKKDEYGDNNFLEIKEFTGKFEDGAAMVSDRELSALLADIPKKHENEGVILDFEFHINKLISSKYEVMSVVWEEITNDGNMQIIFMRRLPEALWRPFYKASAYWKGDFAELIEFSDTQTVKLDMCIANCYWWDRGKERAHIGLDLSSLTGEIIKEY